MAPLPIFTWIHTGKWAIGLPQKRPGPGRTSAGRHGSSPPWIPGPYCDGVPGFPALSLMGFPGYRGPRIKGALANHDPGSQDHGTDQTRGRHTK